VGAEKDHAAGCSRSLQAEQPGLWIPVAGSTIKKITRPQFSIGKMPSTLRRVTRSRAIGSRWRPWGQSKPAAVQLGMGELLGTSSDPALLEGSLKRLKIALE